MSINTGFTIPWGPTVAISAGTASVFTPDGLASGDQLTLVSVSDPNILLRRSIIVARTMPTQPSKVGLRGRSGKSRFVLSVPFVAADGQTFLTGVRQELTFHPEQSDAVKQELLRTAAGIAVSSATQDFWLKLIYG